MDTPSPLMPLPYSQSQSQSTQIPAQQQPNAEQLLAQMEDVIAPEPISQLPIAIGWWILLGLIVASATAAIVALRKRAAARRYRKLALAELKTLRTAQQTNLHDIATLLKRTYINAFRLRNNRQARNKVATATNEEWKKLLIASYPTKKLAQSDAELLDSICSNSLYAKQTNINTQTLLVFAERWIKNHKITATTLTEVN